MAPVPATNKVCFAAGGKLSLLTLPTPQPGPGQVLVQMICSGCCHSDLHIIRGELPLAPEAGITIGHEGVGLVVGHGPGVDESKLPLRTRVGIPFLHQACSSCVDCIDGWENLCGQQQGTGVTVGGTHAEFCVANADFVVRIPEGLSSTAAAPVLCAGVTPYKALKESGARPGQFVAITGAAGGLGHLAVQYAKAMGLKVIGLDAGAAKMEFLRSLGCDHPLDFQAVADVPAEILKVTGGRGADAVLLLAPSSASFGQAAAYAKPRGSIMCIALPTGSFQLPHLQVTTKALSVKGSIVGNRLDMQEALRFSAEGAVRCQVEVRHGLESAVAAYEDMERGAVHGRIVLAIDMSLEPAADGVPAGPPADHAVRHVLLLRHGTPVPEEEDPNRPLSQQGRAEAEATARGVAAYLGAPMAGGAQLAHSGKARARETAEAVQRALEAAGWTCSCEGVGGLDPKDTPDAAADMVLQASQPVLVLVGHLPHMGQLSARLVGEPPAAGRLGGYFTPAGGLALRPGEGGRWIEARQIESGAPWHEEPAAKK